MTGRPAPAVPLDALAEGEWGAVAGYDPGMPPSRRRRFEDLGLIPGTRVARQRSAPLGDPVLIRLRDGLLCLRRCEARHILVERR